MEVLILDVDKPGREGVGVLFQAPFGRGRGLWLSDLPTQGHLYDVELGVDGVLIWGWDICEEACLTPEFRKVSSQWELHGVLEDIEDDGMATLKVDAARNQPGAQPQELLLDTDGPSPSPGTRVVAKIGLPRLWAVKR